MDPAVILAYASALVAGAVAFAFAWYERRSFAHWAFVAGMIVLAAESILAGISADAVLVQDIAYWQDWRLFALSVLPFTWLLFSLAYARGNYREFLRKWRIPLVLALLVPVSLLVLFRGELITSVGRTESGPWMLVLSLPGFGLNLVFLLSAVLVLMNLERTYRAAVGTMRWRIKFMVLGVGVLFAGRAYVSSQALLFHAVNLSLQAVNSGALLVACLLFVASLSRTGHFEVSVYPSHLVLHNSLTVLLAGLYLLIVGVLAKVVAFVGGTHSFTLKAFVVLIALVLLAMLLVSDKVRLRTRRLVSRHFQRPQYDYRTVWRSFAAATARHIEQQDLCGAVVKLVSELFHALSVSIWLVDERQENLVFAASTSLSETKARQLTLDQADAAQVLAGLRQHPDPVDLDASKDIWAILLRRLHPDDFHNGGNRIGVPMISGGELLGVITLGDRVGAVPYSLQDFDLVKSASDQTAASLLNLQLSQKLSQARQLEAFQAMSAFFVHDLKNTASTLSLMLQNLPTHFNDPAFREDALRGISKTVTHVNELIGRLSLLRQETTVKAVESDLNTLVSEALGRLAENEKLNLVRDLHALPKVSVDPAQIQNVVTNLVLNAKDAIGADGQIRIETSQRNGWAVLAVADNGCGMSQEFVQRSLFRPFQTTKKKGIGIGMFQCKMIVEAHHGKIEVESEPGKGTAFRVLLPIAA